jgi:hypothetical protein
MVVQVYNPSYSRVGSRRIMSSRPTLAKVSKDPISKIK